MAGRKIVTDSKARSRAKRDLVLGLAVLLALFLVAGWVDFFELFALWSAAYEDWELDEIFTALALGSLGFAWFSYRRWKDWQRESQHRSEINERLSKEIAVRRETERTLREREDWLHQASQVGKIGYYVWDAVADRCIYCSDEHARLHGLTPEQYIARAAALEDTFSLTHPEDRAAFKEQMRKLRAGQAVKIEYRTLAADGSSRYVREAAQPILDETGKVVREIGTSQDITEQRRTEQEICVRDRWLRAILKNSPIQIVLKDTDGRIMAVSDNVAARMQETPVGFIGKRCDDYLPRETAEVYMKADAEVVASGKAIQQETSEEIDGETRYYFNAKLPLTDDEGAVVGVCSLTSDITERKLAAQRLHQAQKAEAISQLTGGVAHDFNNLLAVIQGNAELIADRIGKDDLLVNAILRASKRGADLTDHLLAFSRQQPLQPRPTDIDRLVAGTMVLSRRTLGETLKIETDLEQGLGHVMVDPGQLENALLNLAINARDAMSAGGTLTLEARNVRFDEDDCGRDREIAAGDYVALSVRDNGSGMSPEVQAKAFEPFFTTKDVGEGSGLGLSMVYGFAKQSGGHVTIDSEPGRGTSVTLFLPRADGEERQEDPWSNEATPRGQGETILIIEDDDEVRACAVRTLERLGYRTVDVADATSGHAVMANGCVPDLLFSDVVLPGGVSGPAFAKQARTTAPDLRVVFISGYPREIECENGATSCGAVLLSKPIRLEPLAKALRDALDGPSRPA